MKNSTTLFFPRKSNNAISRPLVDFSLKFGAREPILASMESADAAKFAFIALIDAQTLELITHLTQLRSEAVCDRRIPPGNRGAMSNGNAVSYGDVRRRGRYES